MYTYFQHRYVSETWTMVKQLESVSGALKMCIYERKGLVSRKQKLSNTLVLERPG